MIVAVGMTLVIATGGSGLSVGSLLAISGVLLRGLILNIPTFECSRGTIILAAHWQSVIRCGFLLIMALP